jgi:hypothetical protein
MKGKTSFASLRSGNQRLDKGKTMPQVYTMSTLLDRSIVQAKIESSTLGEKRILLKVISWSLYCFPFDKIDNME